MGETMLQIEDDRKQMYALIDEQTRTISKEHLDVIMASDVFSIKRLEQAADPAQPDQEQSEILGKIEECRNKQKDYDRELQKLVKDIGTPDGEIAYCYKMIEVEQNNTKLLLLKARVLGMESIMKRIRMEGYGTILTYRRRIAETYRTKLSSSQMQRMAEQQEKNAKAIDREQALYDEEAGKLGLRVLTMAVLEKIETDRGTERKAADTVREFLDADFSTKVLEADYVVANLEECLHNAELVRRVKELKPEDYEALSGGKYELLQRKLEAVREYADVVESVLWDYDFTIDFDTLRIKEIQKGDEAFTKRRCAYLENGALRFYLAVKKYDKSREEPDTEPDKRTDGMRRHYRGAAGRAGKILQEARFVGNDKLADIHKDGCLCKMYAAFGQAWLDEPDMARLTDRNAPKVSHPHAVWAVRTYEKVLGFIDSLSCVQNSNRKSQKDLKDNIEVCMQLYHSFCTEKDREAYWNEKAASENIANARKDSIQCSYSVDQIKDVIKDFKEDMEIYLSDRQINPQLFSESEGQESPYTRTEEKLSALEAELGVQKVRKRRTRIVKAFTRNVNKEDTVSPGKQIRASKEDYLGRMEHLRAKKRFYEIYQVLKERIRQGGEAFRSLEQFVKAYVLEKRDTYENRRVREEKEAAALTALKDALARVHKYARDECGRYAAFLYGLLTEDSNGYLDVPTGGIQIKVKDDHITLGIRKNPRKARGRKYKDCRNMPLFSHRPNIKDVAQGALGDCYLLAGLISVVDLNPEKIMNLMRDNGDGTVTVCFKRKEKEGEQTVYTPHYVTVEKTIPVSKDGNDSFSRGALWVKMMEKAYVASGLNIKLKRINEERKKRRQPELTYEDVRAKIANGRRQVDYDEISGGSVGEFISLLLGKESQNNKLNDENRKEHEIDRFCKLIPPASEPAWGQNAAFGNDRVDSIVYEELMRRDVIRANAFLTIVKPAEGSSLIDPARIKYENFIRQDKREVEVSVCIVHTMAQKSGTDVWRLENSQAVEEWCDSLKKLYGSYVDRKQIRVEGARYRGELQTIEDVVQKYYGCYPTKDKFGAIIDILKERHANRHIGNQPGQQAGNGNAAPARDRYYTTADLTLYERIKGFLRAGAYIAFGTKRLSDKKTGLNGESEAGGMVGTHAYSVINTRKKIIEGVERLFLVVMNPWAEKGVVYDVKAGDIKERAVRGRKDGEKEEGVFLLELRRFVDVVQHWDVVSA